VVIAAGGASSRLGVFKPLAQLRGRPLISYALDCASKAATSVYVLLNNQSQANRLMGLISDSGATVIFDNGKLPFPCSFVGSMAQVDEEVIFLMGCDTPFLDSRLPRLLLSRIGSSGAAVPVWLNGYAEPMMALYVKSRLPLSGTNSSMISILQAMDASFIKIADLGLDPTSFLNINSPSDLRVAETKLFRNMK
jgi:molybdopterin-guanine dinucleotide biosynthesis protein A